jgi:hypothetical protein
MKRLNTTESRIRAALAEMHWATMSHLLFRLTGQFEKRMKSLEYNLPRMAKKRLIKETWWEGRKVYSISHPARLVEHGVACTECLMRFISARGEYAIISEDSFKEQRFGVIPEWGISWPHEATMLLLEFCTADNATRSGVVSRKVNLYRRSLHKFNTAYDVTAVVVFVVDLPSSDVEALALRHLHYEPIFFTDYRVFLSMNYGDALVAPIYLWGDGSTHPLSHD